MKIKGFWKNIYPWASTESSNKWCLIPRVFGVCVPGDAVQAGVGEGAQGSEGGVIVTPLQGGASPVTNLRQNKGYSL